MKKNPVLKILGVVSVCLLTVAFLRIDLLQGQIAVQGKPQRPPGQTDKYSWTAVILDEGTMIGLDAARYDASIPGWVYEDSEPDVDVDVRIGSGPYDGETKYYSKFSFEVFNPVRIMFGITPWYADWFPNTPDALCKYPGEYDPEDPMSMLWFMQNPFGHPQPEYESFTVRFRTDLSVDPSVIDYENWEFDYHEFLNFYGRIWTPPMNLFRPSSCEDLNLSDYSALDFGGNGDYGYFERVGEDTWKVVVGQEILPEPHDYYGNDPSGENDAWACDCYQVCVVEQLNKNKTSFTYDAVFSSLGRFDIKFTMLFIRKKI